MVTFNLYRHLKDNTSVQSSNKFNTRVLTNFRTITYTDQAGLWMRYPAKPWETKALRPEMKATP